MCRPQQTLRLLQKHLHSIENVRHQQLHKAMRRVHLVLHDHSRLEQV